MSQSPPNILLLLIDCLRADALFGEQRGSQTPTLDSLVRSGVACTQAVSSASSTTPCVASLLTGTYSFVHGIRSIFGLKLSPTVSSLAEAFQAHGYHTYAEVSGPLFPETHLNQGFDSYHSRAGPDYLSTQWGVDFRHRLQNGEYQQPWFMFLHVWELHHHRHILPDFRSRAYGRNRYERALSSLDSELASLLALLPPNTIVAIHGDHGERVVKTDLGYRTYRLFRDLFGSSVAKREGHEMDISEDLIRVPLVFSFLGQDGHPQLPAGKKVSQLVRQIDVMPTLLDLAGAPAPPNLHGQSLVSALHADSPLNLEAYLEAFLRIHSNPRDRRVGWRTEDWKYMYAPQNPDLPEELYDLKNDPREQHNLVSTQSKIKTALRGRIEALQNGPLAANPGQEMSAAEQQALEKRMADLGYL
jgi:arylsulfatase A-like enzyme